jgi:hypothetical protein
MGATDANRQPLATDTELAQPAAALLLSQVVGPALGTLLPSTWSRGAGDGAPTAPSSPPAGGGGAPAVPGAMPRATGGPAAAAAAGVGTTPDAALQEDVSALARTIAELQATIKGQQRDIDRLKKK